MKYLRVLTGLFLGLATPLLCQINPVPFLSEPLVPSSVAPGSPGFTLSLHGAGFVSGSIVNWNGVPQPTTFVTTSHLDANIPSSEISKTGTVPISVSSPSPGGGTSNVAFFTVRTPSSSLAVNTSVVATGIGPFSVIAGDFNKDGNLDLAVANQTDFSVSVLLGNGNGTFQPRVDYSLGAKPSTPPHLQVITRDFNEDGILDLAVAGGPNVTVFLGKGNGTFGSAVPYATISGPESIVAGDFNRDGHLDLAVGNSTFNGTDTVLLGNGDGTFHRGANFVGGKNALAITTGDFTSDGILDLAVLGNALHENAVYFLTGVGDGTFSFPSKFSTSSLPKSIVGADFNGDTFLDMAVTDNGTNSISILLGNGNGTFQPHVDYVAGTKPVGLATGDLNGDGILDLALTCQGSNQMTVLLGNGNGTFQAPIAFRTGKSPRSVVVGDFNNDGKLDFAVTNWGSNTLSILLQR